MSEPNGQIRCQFTLSTNGVQSVMHVGSVLNLTLDVPDQYAGDSVGSLRCVAHVVAVEAGDGPGKVSVVCEIDTLECDPGVLDIAGGIAAGGTPN